MNKLPKLSRRELLALGGAGLASMRIAAAPTLAQRPDPSSFQSGDLVWPKPSGAFIPYAGVSPEKSTVSALELREEEWQQMRVDFVKTARANATGLAESERLYQLQLARFVEELTYSGFINMYSAGVTADDYQTYGTGQLAYVGHVALIEVDPASGTPYIVEAVYGKNISCESCVQRVTYAKWLETRGDILIWHGRVRNLDALKRAAIIAEAKKQLSKPYKFFNFNLADAGGFYCSKLAWFAIREATGIAVDGNEEPRRLIWFSPLQLMRSKTYIELLSSPGNYRNV
ncbi:YiiX/YebB-like N1pC/P60 family cysteine hydrolase [Paucibacter sp. O1-1]|nr:YiiX/YebB-like N1pC/P60 family cysteine hydrolase [Paucibacter sp. O1-1]MDA3829209.1 YiiX/YebB-like N1pC/P60 family cysteine hydrolase [Paucibacter sp. O1-1]